MVKTFEESSRRIEEELQDNKAYTWHNETYCGETFNEHRESEIPRSSTDFNIDLQHEQDVTMLSNGTSRFDEEVSYNIGFYTNNNLYLFLTL